MPRFADHAAFAEEFIINLPSLQDFETRDIQFWDMLEVNADRVLSDARDVEFLENSLTPLGAGGLQVLCLWVGLDPMQSKALLKTALAEYLVGNLELPGCQTLVLINEFLYRRRADAIETIAQLILPEDQFEHISSNEIDANSKRLCYTLLAYVDNPHLLRLLMLFESAERAGYARYVLLPKNDVDEEVAELAQQHINTDADITLLDAGRFNDMLEAFEQRHGRQQSLCYEVFRDEESGKTLVFILRYLRESYIREVEQVVFAAEAELIVLRFDGGVQNVEEHSASGIGIPIAAWIASELLNDPNIQYIEDTQLTRQEDLEALIEVLADGEDERLRFQELYLHSAPVEEAPILILRCDKSRDLSGPLEFFRQRNIGLLQDLSDIRKVNIAFVIETADGQEKAYIFKVFSKLVSPGRYYLPYSVANISTRIRAEFEAYLQEEYDVQVVPGTG